MRILLDVDGVICNFSKFWEDCAERVLNKRPTIHNHHEWEMVDRYKLSDNEAALVNTVVHTTACNPEPLRGAIAGVKQLMREQHDVYFVTTSMDPHQTWDHDRRRWFDRNFGEEARQRLIFAIHKGICSGDMFIDDRRLNVLNWMEHNPSGTGLVFGTHDCENWEELLSIVRKHNVD